MKGHKCKFKGAACNFCAVSDTKLHLIKRVGLTSGGGALFVVNFAIPFRRHRNYTLKLLYHIITKHILVSNSGK